MRQSFLLLLLTTALAGAAAADAKPQPPGDQDAAAIAARIIRLRALDVASSGNTELAIQLESLAHGVADGRIPLADAALVMQIANAPARVAAPLTAQAKSATRAAESLLDGDTASAAPPAHATPAGPAQSTMPGADADVSATATGPASGPAATAALPGMNAPAQDAGAGARTGGKVYAVDSGTGTQVIAVALSITAKQGAEKGQHYLIMRGATTIAEARLTKVAERMSYGEIIKGSLRDATNDVREGDQAVLAP